MKASAKLKIRHNVTNNYFTDQGGVLSVCDIVQCVLNSLTLGYRGCSTTVQIGFTVAGLLQ